MGTPPWLPFQDEMLAASELLTSSGLDAQFRWRPHPADLDRLIEPALKRYPALELSRGTDLEADIEWAHVIVSSISTSIIQALFAGIPIFVHLIPEFQDLPLTDFVAPERSFFRAEELASKLRSCLEAWMAGDPAALRPDQDARVALFGPSGLPPNLFESLDRLAASMRDRSPIERLGSTVDRQAVTWSELGSGLRPVATVNLPARSATKPVRGK